MFSGHRDLVEGVGGPSAHVAVVPVWPSLIVVEQRGIEPRLKIVEVVEYSVSQNAADCHAAKVECWPIGLRSGGRCAC